MMKPIIISYKLTTCQLIYLTNTYKPREILLQYQFKFLTNYCLKESLCNSFSAIHSHFSSVQTFIYSLNIQ